MKLIRNKDGQILELNLGDFVTHPILGNGIVTTLDPLTIEQDGNLLVAVDASSCTLFGGPLLTTKTARHLMRDLFEWLLASKAHSTSEWPRWQSLGGDVPAMDVNCPACAFIRTHKTSCKDCPIEGWDPEYSNAFIVSDMQGAPCMRPTSPWYRFTRSWVTAKPLLAIIQESIDKESSDETPEVPPA
jgi:hypothetical protein